jgi:hypothetical protein
MRIGFVSWILAVARCTPLRLANHPPRAHDVKERSSFASVSVGLEIRTNGAAQAGNVER